MGGDLVSDSQSIATLRQWAVDAATANTNWPTMTAGQKDATTREVIRRLGLLMTNLADVLENNRFAE